MAHEAEKRARTYFTLCGVISHMFPCGASFNLLSMRTTRTPATRPVLQSNTTGKTLILSSPSLYQFRVACFSAPRDPPERAKGVRSHRSLDGAGAKPCLGCRSQSLIRPGRTRPARRGGGHFLRQTGPGS